MNSLNTQSPVICFAVPSAKRYQNQYYSNQPNRFVNLSVTGRTCACRCEHCNGSLLGSMLDVSSPERFQEVIEYLDAQGCKGILVSGGADGQGKVPLLPFLESIHEAVQKGLQVIVHTGLIDRPTARGLKEAGVQQVLIDIIGDTATIHEVYHLDAEPEDYLDAMLDCKEEGLAIAPHIVMGLHYGQIKGELRALEMISQVNPVSLVLVILNPIKGTGMEGIQVPVLGELESVLQAARKTAGEAPIALGCARPPGPYKRNLEKRAVDLGFDVITYPDEQTISYCLERGFNPVFVETCCSLAAQHIRSEKSK